MMRLLSAFVLMAYCSNVYAATAPSPACGTDDIPCIRRLLLQKADEAASLARELGQSKLLVDTLSKTVEVLKADNASLAAVIKPAADALKATQLGWYERPAFLLSVGVFGGILLTVLAIWGVGYLSQSLAASRG